MAAASGAAERATWVRSFEGSRDAAAVCRQYGISPATLRKWWRRYEDAGLAGLEDASRTPRRSPARKVFEAEAARIRALRAGGLSLARIRTALRVEGGLDVSVPTIRKVLSRADAAGGAAQLPVPRADAAGPGLFSGILPDDPVTRAVAAEIAGGAFQPGERLTEERLGRLLRVDRTRVRQALRALAMVGLVGVERRGAVVAMPSSRSVADAYAARRLVEGGIVRALAARHDKGHLEVLRHHLRRQSDAERRGDKVALVRLLTEFHLVLAALAGNPFLHGFIQLLASTTSLAVLLYDRSEMPSCAVEEHRALVRLIEAGKGEAADALMARHLGHNQQRQRQPGPSAPEPPDDAA